jgi:hypothetical protein
MLSSKRAAKRSSSARLPSYRPSHGMSKQVRTPSAMGFRPSAISNIRPTSSISITSIQTPRRAAFSPTSGQLGLNKILVWCWPRLSLSGASYLVQKCESKSWALPAAATIGKTKISPAPREFSFSEIFSTRLYNKEGYPPVHHPHPSAIAWPIAVPPVRARALDKLAASRNTKQRSKEKSK